jgi:hypothetical protein
VCIHDLWSFNPDFATLKLNLKNLRKALSDTDKEQAVRQRDNGKAVQDKDDERPQTLPHPSHTNSTAAAL